MIFEFVVRVNHGKYVKEFQNVYDITGRKI